jgi:hypothetical protein
MYTPQKKNLYPRINLLDELQTESISAIQILLTYVLLNETGNFVTNVLEVCEYSKI